MLNIGFHSTKRNLGGFFLFTYLLWSVPTLNTRNKKQRRCTMWTFKISKNLRKNCSAKPKHGKRRAVPLSQAPVFWCASVHVYHDRRACWGMLMCTLHNVCVCVRLDVCRQWCGCSAGNWWMGCLKSRIWMKKREPWGNILQRHCNQSLDGVPAFD